MKFPSLPAIVSKVFPSLVAKSGTVTMDGFIDDSWGLNFWQKGYNPVYPTGRSAIVAACVSAYAQTTAMCPGTHWRRTSKGGRERVSGSALTRIIRQPNSYQSISDFLLNLVRNLYDDGNAYCFIQRNARFEPQAVHLMRSNASGPRIAINGEIFYALGGNEVVDRMVDREDLGAVPARDVIHVRLDTKHHTLLGEPPIVQVAMEKAASDAVLRQTVAFLNNQARPSMAFQTDAPLNREQNQDLKQRIRDEVQGPNAGGLLVLSNGLKVVPVSVTSRDAQLAEIMQMSDQHIASAYRTPLGILSLLAGQGPQGSTESLLQFWLATGLGFCLNHIEEAFGLAFGLRGQPDEYLEFDTSALLRSLFRDRIEGLARGVQGGIFSPNEARAMVELPEMEYGDEPRLQQQDVPLSAWYATQAAPPVLAPPAAPADPAPPTDTGNPAPPAGPPASAPPPKEFADAIGSAELAELVYASIDRHEREPAPVG